MLFLSSQLFQIFAGPHDIDNEWCVYFVLQEVTFLNSLQLNTLHLVVFARWYQYYLFLPFFGIPEALKVYHSKHFVFQLSETEFRWKTRLQSMRTISQPCFSGSGTLSLETRQLVFVEEAGFYQGVVEVCHVICLKHCFPSFKCDDKRMTVRKSSCNLSRTVSRF